MEFNEDYVRDLIFSDNRFLSIEHQVTAAACLAQENEYRINMAKADISQDLLNAVSKLLAELKEAVLSGNEEFLRADQEDFRRRLEELLS